MHRLPTYLAKFPKARFRQVALKAGLVAVLITAVCGPIVLAFPLFFKVDSFSPWQGYAIPNGVWLTGDFNGDGKTDVFHAVANTDYANIWLSNGDGTFNVHSFSPWPGYAIPNGIWMVGDVNGDGKADIIHAVANTDYVNIWLSNGNGTFTVKSFSPWPGYAIPNGVWMVGDVNGDGKADIIHAVANTDYANIWLSNGNGTFTMKSFSPWPGYAIPNGIWMVGDVNGDGKADIIHAVANTDYANIWLSNGNGTFNVHSFSPWPGYAIPNGIWMVGDVNGDGKADIIHAVANTDYANIWLSNGNGTFNVHSFSPWPGYAIPNGVWMVGDVNGDGKADIIHAVANTDYANIWLSNGNGTFNVQSFSPWPGYAIPNGLWMVGDYNGDHKADILHAVQGTDYANVWLSGLPAPGQFGIDGMELTQSVQDMDETVPVVGAKPGVVRAYVSLNAANSENVKGVVTVQPGNRRINSDNVVTVNPALNYQIPAKRNNLASSLNFSIGAPSNGTQVTVTPPTLMDANTGAVLNCGNCNASSVSVGVQNSVTLRVQVIGLSYTTGTPPQTFSPRQIDFTLINSWLGRAYPVGPTQITYNTRTVASTSTWPFDCNAANAQVSTIRNNDINGGVDHRTHYVGLVFDGGTGGNVGPNFMRGCAAGIPTSADPSTVASAPTGPGTWGWDNDGSYGDWYLGHELAHTFGRYHPGFCNGNSHDDSNFPYPNGQIAHNDDDFVGLDNGDGSNGIARSALTGTGSFDIMTYCSNLWLSAYAYEGVFARMQAENTLAAGPAPSGGSGSGAESPGLRTFRIPAIALERTPPAHVIERLQNLRPSLPQRPEPVRGASEQVKAAFGSTVHITPVPVRGIEKGPTVERGISVQPKPVFGAETPPAFILRTQTASPVHPIVFPAQLEPQQGDFVNIIATLNLTRGTGHITFVNRLNRAIVPPVAGATNASIRFMGASGQTVSEHPVPTKLSTDILPGQDQTALIDAVLPAAQNVARIELVYAGKVLDTLAVPAHAPTMGEISQEASVVRIQTARPGEFENQPARKLAWKVSHPDSAKLTYTVQFSKDDGKTWETVAVGLPSPDHTLTLQETGGATNVQLRVTANDGYHSVTSKPVAVTIK